MWQRRRPWKLLRNTGRETSAAAPICVVRPGRPDNLWLTVSVAGGLARGVSACPRPRKVAFLRVFQMLGQLCAFASGLKAAGYRRIFAFSAVLTVTPMLTSCISADRPDLGIEIPWSYRAAPPATKLAPPKLDWWRGFRSKELTDLIQEAHTGNFDIAIAVARIMQADANSKIASAPMLPSVNLESSATRTKSSAAANGGVGSTKNNFTAFLNASYEIDFWGKNRAASKAAEELAISARFDRDTVSISTVVSVATAYFLVLESQDRLRIARENVMAAENILNLIRKRASGEGGTASQLEVSQQEVLVGQQRSLIPQFDQTLRQNIATLAVLVGRAPSFMKVRGGSL